jgi:branched-chain amino acid aminotransferase
VDTKIAISDRGFLYGDGLFESLRVYGGNPFAWDRHWARLQDGANFLKIKISISSAELKSAAAELLQKNQSSDCVLRIQISRGIGQRGYSIQGAGDPTIVMTVHNAPRLELSALNWKLITSSLRIFSGDPLSRFKTCNKLNCVLARMEADAKNVNDALLLNERDELAETTSCNLFWIENGIVFTPPIASGALPGVTRGLIFDLCRNLKIPCEERVGHREHLLRADGVFLTSSVMEIIEAVELDGQNLRRSHFVDTLLTAFREARRSGAL